MAGAVGNVATVATVAQERPADFSHDILPLLRDRCAACHTNGRYEGGLSLDTRATLIDGDVIDFNQPHDSELILRVTSDDPDYRMPAEGPPLTEEEVARLVRWINQGAPWEDGFSFKKEVYEAPLGLARPQLSAGDPNDHPIDRWLRAYRTEHDLGEPDPVGDAVFCRRAWLDLVGLLPSRDAVESFVRDAAGDKRRRLVDALLDNRRAYAEHWLTFWNDLLRNDYAGTGYIDGGRRPITAWLYQALLDNRPYDQMVRQLVAPEAESSGFLLGIQWRGNVNASQIPELQFAQNSAQVFLGINLKCASCHDSFVDNWKLADAYGLAAVAAAGPLPVHRCDKPTGDMAQPAFLFPELGTIEVELSREERLSQLAALMTSPKNGRLARTIVNRLWHRLMGRGLVEPLDDMNRPPWHVELLEWLAADFVDHGCDLKHTMRLIATSGAYASAAAGAPDDAEPFVFRGPQPRRLTAEQFTDAVWQVTGQWPATPDADFGDRGGAPVRAALVKSNSLMRVLGRPNREQVVTSRPPHMTTLEALDLQSGAWLAGVLDRGSRHMLQARAADSPEQLVDHLFWSVLSRPATPEEASVALEVCGAPAAPEGLADLMWILLMLPEFQAVQ